MSINWPCLFIDVNSHCRSHLEFRFGFQVILFQITVKMVNVCTIFTVSQCSSAPVSAGNTSQEILRLHETAGNTERYKQRAIRVNKHTYGKVCR
jgi:hypothetical protein